MVRIDGVVGDRSVTLSIPLEIVRIWVRGSVAHCEYRIGASEDTHVTSVELTPDYMLEDERE